MSTEGRVRNLLIFIKNNNSNFLEKIKTYILQKGYTADEFREAMALFYAEQKSSNNANLQSQFQQPSRVQSQDFESTPINVNSSTEVISNATNSVAQVTPANPHATNDEVSVARTDQYFGNTETSTQITNSQIKETNAVSTSTTESKESNKKKPKLFVAVFVILLLIFIGLALWYFSLIKSNGTKAKPNQSRNTPATPSIKVDKKPGGE